MHFQNGKKILNAQPSQKLFKMYKSLRYLEFSNISNFYKTFWKFQLPKAKL